MASRSAAVPTSSGRVDRSRQYDFPPHPITVDSRWYASSQASTLSSASFTGVLPISIETHTSRSPGDTVEAKGLTISASPIAVMLSGADTLSVGTPARYGKAMQIELADASDSVWVCSRAARERHGFRARSPYLSG